MALVLLLALSAVLCACGNDETDGKDTDAVTTAEESTSAESEAESTSDTSDTLPPVSDGNGGGGNGGGGNGGGDVTPEYKLDNAGEQSDIVNEFVY